jgi:excinuclease ABC subunit B
MDRFQLVTDMTPKGDQPEAIATLTKGVLEGRKFHTLLGVTGSGKTYTAAHVIAGVNQPTLVISHNKTLGAQLYSEFKEFFPRNAVEYFVSYYDYYQPEAYVPQTDTYIEKDASINDDLDRLRLSATSSLLTRRDVIIVATVSCIYNLGDPEEYKEQMVWFEVGKPARRDEVLSWLVGIHYTRNDVAFARGTFRARGEVLDVFPAYRQTAYRIHLADGRIARIQEIDPLTADGRGELQQIAIYPAKHFVTRPDRIARAVEVIQQELVECVRNLQAQGKLLEAQRLQARTTYDMEMLRELGFCHGVENYSRHLSGRAPGSRPPCLMDYFPKDYLLIIDESHVTVPQIRGMYEGDRARKETLVEYGFRLPSALDNRPQRFDEFEALLHQVIFASATPGPYELARCGGKVVEQIIRPTGLVDPAITLKPTQGQIDDLIEQVRRRAARAERVLVTTLTKRLAEDLTRYLGELTLRVKYLHSEIDAIERVQILQDLRRGKFDCLVGINLLREGLDLPEVSLVAVLDADKEGFLRSATSLIQVAGRAARHVNGEVILYADRMTGAMRQMIQETNRRRAKQLEHNRRHGITPTTIVKAIRDGIEAVRQAEAYAVEQSGQSYETHQVRQTIAELEEEMLLCARALQFERAAQLRDDIHSLRERYHLTPQPADGRRSLRRQRAPLSEHRRGTPPLRLRSGRRPERSRGTPP